MDNNYGVPAHIQQANTVDMGDGLLQRKVRAVVEATQAPQSMVLQAALGMGSFALGPHLRVKAPNGQLITLQIYCVGVAESGERKTTVLDYFIDPIQELMDDFEIQNKEIMHQYKNDMETWKAIRRRIISQIAKESIE
jgi:hypothetical protein